MSGFSNEWDARFRAGGNISRWPWSDVVGYVHRHARPLSDFRRVLELGCAAGPNIPFFLSLECDYFAIEGSQAIVEKVRANYPALAEKVVAGDFTESLHFPGPFDLIVDRSSVTHNSTVAIRRTLRTCFEGLRPGGKYLGFDWFSMAYRDAQRGVTVDAHTRTGIPDGQFQDIGAVHFSDRPHIEEIVQSAGFTLERLEHRQTDTYLPRGEEPKGWWSFVAVKP